MTTGYDRPTVESFGREWQAFDQSGAGSAELERLFLRYFSDFPWDLAGSESVGLDAGCGSGRWARFVSERVGGLVCLDPSSGAAGVAARNLAGQASCHVVIGAAGQLPIRPGSLDFGYSLGVLHHTPDPALARGDCVGALKPGAPFLVYLYYALDGRPGWFRALWRASDALRRVISRAPYGVRRAVTWPIAAAVYWPLARAALLAEHTLGRDVGGMPLAFYRDKAFYVMRNDALDRFGTPLERRFTAAEVRRLMEAAGLTDVRLAEGPPYWRAVGVRPGAGS